MSFLPNFNDPAVMMIIYIWIIGGITFAIPVSLYWLTWGNLYMKAYIKNVRAGGKKLWGVLSEGTSGYYRLKIVDFSPSLIDGKYQKDDTRIKHVRYWVATIPFAMADTNSNFLLPLAQDTSLTDKEGRAIKVSSDALQIAAQDLIELELRQLQAGAAKLLLILVGVTILVGVIGIVVGYLAFDNAQKAAAAATFVAQHVSEAAGGALATVH